MIFLGIIEHNNQRDFCIIYPNGSQVMIYSKMSELAKTIAKSKSTNWQKRISFNIIDCEKSIDKHLEEQCVIKELSPIIRIAIIKIINEMISEN